MIGYLAPAASRLLQAAQLTFQILPKSFNTTPHLSDKGVPPTSREPPLDGTSARYLEEMYNSWLKDSTSVHPSWDAYFRTFKTSPQAYMPPPSFRAPPAPPSQGPSAGAPPVSAGAPPISAGAPPISATAPPIGAGAPPVSAGAPPVMAISRTPPTASPPTSQGPPSCTQTVQEHMNVQSIIRSYQVRGHLAARTNPLNDMFDVNDKNISYSEKYGKNPSEVLRNHKLDPSMWGNSYLLPASTKIGGNEPQLPLKEIIKRLELTYCRHIGVEYMHIHDAEQLAFIREKFEVPGAIELRKPEKRLMLTRLAKAVLFEAFLKKKWSSEKRFGIEGCDVLIPCVKMVIDEAAKRNAEMAVIGMAHRGRLNILANVCHKPLYLIFAQFRGLRPDDEGAGDVKYHLGVYDNREHSVTKKPFVTVLVANPSHLEMVNPVCAGRAKAEQFARNDPKGEKVIPMLMHGDAAFCGEGIVYESINLTNLTGYSNGGTIHFVVNNQVGFTTDPEFSRSCHYCSDVAKFINVPVFHVNSEDPESAVYAAKVAAEWRFKFHKDVVIDIVSYRRHGHNETDEPMFTQPLMYKQIKDMPDVFEKYSVQAVKQGFVTDAEVKTFRDDFEKLLEEEFAKAAKETSIRFGDWIDAPWKKFFNKDQLKCPPTGISMDVIEHIAKKYSEPPPDFELHKGLMRVMTMRQDMVKNKTADWAIGEALAIGSLLKEGIHVRLSGEDVQRGTFSHRHHVVHHQSKPKTSYKYLADLYPDQAFYTVTNSPISEYGVLGFEHGYSMARPDYLVIWEAQFGDFANNAQPIFDCMIASGQWKWIRQCGMVVLLPHGLEGQGPEHSSARVERYLQLSADDPDYLPPESPDFGMKQLHDINWIVANCTTPANIFHILRRQIKLPFRKPLILLTPKSLLRHPEARSKFDDMKEGTEFQRLIPATGPASQNPGNVKKIIFCSGKVYFEFVAVIKEKKLEDQIAVARIEQICPFPYDLVQKESNKYSNAQIAWGQEEHKNSGCWSYVEPRLETAFKGKKEIHYVGRAPSASTASGNKIQYQAEYKALMDSAVKL